MCKTSFAWYPFIILSRFHLRAAFRLLKEKTRAPALGTAAVENFKEQQPLHNESICGSLLNCYLLHIYCCKGLVAADGKRDTIRHFNGVITLVWRQQSCSKVMLSHQSRLFPASHFYAHTQRDTFLADIYREVLQSF